MTPFEEAGYTKETKFRVLVNEGDLKIGDIVTLSQEDDGNACPYFETEDGRGSCKWLPNKVSKYCEEELEVYEEPIKELTPFEKAGYTKDTKFIASRNLYEWRNVGSLCEHCGEPIEQRPVNTQDLCIVSGFEPMEYRHLENKEQICTRILKDNVRPYDECRQYEKYFDSKEEKTSCPDCGSNYVSLNWVTPTSQPEYQFGTCEDCGDTWNECTRDT